MPLDQVKSGGKFEPRWKDAVYPGLKMDTGDRLVGTPEGMFKFRSVRRKPEPKRWSADQVQAMNGTPWKPCGFTDDDRVRMRIPEVVKEDVGIDIQARGADVAPKKIRIDTKYVPNHRISPQCPGCYAAANDLNSRHRTLHCRKRIEEALSKDPLGEERLRGVEKRRAAFSEKSKPGEKADEVPALGAGEAARPKVREVDWDFMPEADAEFQDDDDAAISAPAEDIYQTIDEVDTNDDNDDNVTSKLVGIIQNAVSEAYSPPKIAPLSPQYELQAGFIIGHQDQRRGRPTM